MLKTSWRRLEDVWPRWIYWSWPRRLEDVFWRHKAKANIFVLKTSSSRRMFAGIYFIFLLLVFCRLIHEQQRHTPTRFNYPFVIVNSKYLRLENMKILKILLWKYFNHKVHGVCKEKNFEYMTGKCYRHKILEKYQGASTCLKTFYRHLGWTQRFLKTLSQKPKWATLSARCLNNFC